MDTTPYMSKKKTTQNTKKANKSTQGSNQGAQRTGNNVPTSAPRPASQNMVCKQVAFLRLV